MSSAIAMFHGAEAERGVFSRVLRWRCLPRRHTRYARFIRLCRRFTRFSSSFVAAPSSRKTELRQQLTSGIFILKSLLFSDTSSLPEASLAAVFRMDSFIDSYFQPDTRDAIPPVLRLRHAMRRESAQRYGWRHVTFDAAVRGSDAMPLPSCRCSLFFCRDFFARYADIAMPAPAPIRLISAGCCPRGSLMPNRDVFAAS